MRKLLCAIFGHQWHRLLGDPEPMHGRYGTARRLTGKRRCIRCGREQWLFSRRFPAIGEPARYWGDAP